MNRKEKPLMTLKQTRSIYRASVQSQPCQPVALEHLATPAENFSTNNGKAVGTRVCEQRLLRHESGDAQHSERNALRIVVNTSSAPGIIYWLGYCVSSKRCDAEKHTVESNISQQTNLSHPQSTATNRWRRRGRRCRDF